MGLNKQSEQRTYLTVMDGKLIKAHKEPIPGVTKSRENKLKRLVHEEMFNDLVGKLVNISTREHKEYGKQWVITFEADGEFFIVQVPYSGRLASSFLRALPNVELNLPIKFKPWQMADRKDPSKKVSGITMYQNDEKILPYYTKEEQNGLPDMTKKRVKGNEIWDDTEMMEFLENMVNTEILPIIKQSKQQPQQQLKVIEAELMEKDDEEIPDMPF